MIRRRHVFHIAGYDPVQPSDQYRRFARQLDIFKDTWNVRSTLSASSQPHGYPRWTIWTSGPDWTVESTYELLPWDDLVRKDAQGSEPLRLLRSAQVYLNLFVTGTLFRYTKANTRYFVFTLFPWLQIALLAVVAWYPASILFSLWNPIGAPNAAMQVST